MLVPVATVTAAKGLQCYRTSCQTATCTVQFRTYGSVHTVSVLVDQKCIKQMYGFTLPVGTQLQPKYDTRFPDPPDISLPCIILQ